MERLRNRTTLGPRFRRGVLAALVILWLIPLTNTPLLGQHGEGPVDDEAGSRAGEEEAAVHSTVAAVVDRDTSEYVRYFEDQARRESEALQALQGEVLEAVRRLSAIQRDLDRRVREEDEAAEQRVEDLVRIYQGMKPAVVTRLLLRLEPELRYDMLSRMRSSIVSRILAQMTPAQAAEASRRLIEIRSE